MRVLLPIIAGVFCAGLSGAANAITYFAHTETVVNNTGAAANDITLELIHPALEKKGVVSIASSVFAGGTACCVNSSTVTITSPGPTVAGNGGSMTVGWLSAFASDLLLNTSFWTSNGVNIGPVTTNNAISLNVTPNANGTVTVAVNNTSGAPAAYSGLMIDNGAPISDFAANTAFPDLDMGTPVTPMIATSGTLPTGVTTLATFKPSATGYFGDELTINGITTFLGDATFVPEPASWTLLLLGAGAAGAALRGRRAIERSTSRSA